MKNTTIFTVLVLSLIWVLPARAETHAGAPNPPAAPAAAPTQSAAERVTAAYQAFVGRPPTERELGEHVSGGQAIPLVIQSIIDSPQAAERARTIPADALCPARAQQVRVASQVLGELRLQFHERVICVGYCHARYRDRAGYTHRVTPVIRGRGVNEAAAMSNVSTACLNEAHRLATADSGQVLSSTVARGTSPLSESSQPSAQCLPL